MNQDSILIKIEKNLTLIKHIIKRVYQLLVRGKIRPQSGTINTLIRRSTKNRQLMEVGTIKGKKAILVIEEGQPEFIEHEIGSIIRKSNLSVSLNGKNYLPMAGEYTPEVICVGLSNFLKENNQSLLHNQSLDYFKDISSAELVNDDLYTIRFNCSEVFFKQSTMIGTMQIMPKHIYDPKKLMNKYTFQDLENIQRE